MTRSTADSHLSTMRRLDVKSAAGTMRHSEVWLHSRCSLPCDEAWGRRRGGRGGAAMVSGTVKGTLTAPDAVCSRPRSRSFAARFVASVFTSTRASGGRE